MQVTTQEKQNHRHHNHPHHNHHYCHQNLRHEHSRCFPPGGGGTEVDVSKPDDEPSAGADAGDDGVDRGWRRRRVPLGQEGWRVCLGTTLLPAILPWRAHQQHKNITELYPVESTTTEKVGRGGTGAFRRLLYQRVRGIDARTTFDTATKNSWNCSLDSTRRVDEDALIIKRLIYRTFQCFRSVFLITPLDFCFCQSSRACSGQRKVVSASRKRRPPHRSAKYVHTVHILPAERTERKKLEERKPTKKHFGQHVIDRVGVYEISKVCLVLSRRKMNAMLNKPCGQPTRRGDQPETQCMTTSRAKTSCGLTPPLIDTTWEMKRLETYTL